MGLPGVQQSVVQAAITEFSICRAIDAPNGNHKRLSGARMFRKRGVAVVPVKLLPQLTIHVNLAVSIYANAQTNREALRGKPLNGFGDGNAGTKPGARILSLPVKTGLNGLPIGIQKAVLLTARNIRLMKSPIHDRHNLRLL